MTNGAVQSYVQIKSLKYVGNRDPENWRAPSVPELIRRWDHYLERIPDDRRWNIFYTAAECNEDKKFERQTVLAFDLDGVPEDMREAAANLVADVLNVNRDASAIISTGNGVHVLFELQNSINRESYFKEARAAYGEVCWRIDLALRSADIPGSADPHIFNAGRLLRMPGTENRKTGNTTQCRLLRQGLRPVGIDLMAFNPNVPSSPTLSAYTVTILTYQGNAYHNEVKAKNSGAALAQILDDADNRLPEAWASLEVRESGFFADPDNPTPLLVLTRPLDAKVRA